MSVDCRGQPEPGALLRGWVFVVRCRMLNSTPGSGGTLNPASDHNRMKEMRDG